MSAQPNHHPVCAFKTVDPRTKVLILANKPEQLECKRYSCVTITAAGKKYPICRVHFTELQMLGVRAKFEHLAGVLRQAKQGGCIRGFRRHNFDINMRLCKRCGKFQNGEVPYPYLLHVALHTAAQRCLRPPFVLFQDGQWSVFAAYPWLEDGSGPDLSKAVEGYAAAVMKIVNDKPAYTFPMKFETKGSIELPEIETKLGEAVLGINEFEKEHPYIDTLERGGLVSVGEILGAECTKCRLIHPMDVNCQDRNSRIITA